MNISSESNRAWLDDYALFMAAKDAHQGKVWTCMGPGPGWRVVQRH